MYLTAIYNEGFVYYSTSNMELSVSTFGLIRNAQEQVLFLRRHPDDSFGNLWDIPGGGIEPGEQPSAAAVREVLEESGLRVQKGKLLTSIACGDPENKKWTVFLLYTFTYNGELAHVSIDESHTEYRWLTLERAQKELELCPALVALIQQLEQERLL